MHLLQSPQSRSKMKMADTFQVSIGVCTYSGTLQWAGNCDLFLLCSTLSLPLLWSFFSVAAFNLESLLRLVV